jgi:hypothetical protein
MELPILEPAPVVSEHTAVFRDVFENQCQFRHFQHDLTGLIVLPNKSMANMARCILKSADKTNLSRVLSEAPWREDAIHHRRLQVLLSRPSSIAVDGASRLWPSTRPCANTSGVSLTTWIDMTSTATARTL